MLCLTMESSPDRLRCQARAAVSMQGGEAESLVEVAELTGAWAVFRQLVAGAAPRQPVLLVATAHTALLPPDLLRYFGRCPVRLVSTATAQVCSRHSRSAPERTAKGSPACIL